MVIFITIYKINSFSKQKILHYSALPQQADDQQRFLLEVTATPPGHTILAEMFRAFSRSFQESALTVS
jgi:hypothetical protein